MVSAETMAWQEIRTVKWKKIASTRFGLWKERTGA